MSKSIAPEPLFEKVALVGLGLIGSSICHGMRAEGLAGEVVGYARSKETRDVALEIGLVDKVEDTSTKAVEDADLVILCVPVGITGKVMEGLARALKPGAILTDVGSVKAKVIDMVQPHLPGGVHFVPAHPIAGTEESGPRSGFADLFHGRWCILTPLKGGDEAATEKLAEFWTRLGSNVEIMDAEHHDLVLAITSHVPHLIAYNIVGTAADMEEVTRWKSVV